LQHFIEPEGSLPHSQVPATCTNPEPGQSSPYPHIPLSEDPSLYYFFHLSLGLPSGLFPSDFPIKTLYQPFLSSIPATCPTHLVFKTHTHIFMRFFTILAKKTAFISLNDLFSL
jgi:hypothetical protein